MLNEKTTIELQIDDLYRQLKEKDEEKQNLLNLKILELKNSKQNHEKKMEEKTAYIKQLQQDVDTKKELITKNQEMIL